MADSQAPTLHTTRSTCPYCGVGCGVLIDSTEGQITGVRGDPEHPANFGRLCSKGSTLAQTAARPITLHQRLLAPRLHGQVVDWSTALDTAADRFATIAQNHGADALGFYVSGQLLTEDYYAFNKLAKGLLGTNNIDTNSRLCMSSAVAGYKATLGADAPPCSYEDLDAAGTVFIAGSNMAWAHPILFRRLEAARQANPHMKVVVVDPRRTETAAFADLHLALQPGTDVALFNGLLHLLLQEGLHNPAYIGAHTSGFEALRARVQDCTPALTAQVCGVSEGDLAQAARWFAQGPTLSLYCQGLNQSSSGTAKNASLINLHLATGQIGQPGAGPFSLTGQPNAMGGREVGGLANLLSAHRDLANPAHRAEVAALWGVPEVPAKPGKTAVEMFQAAADGEIKALWIACTNPAQSLPDQATVQRALQRAEFVVLQEAFATTATAPYAHLLLPASSWGEKEGTVTNSERRISRVRAAVPPPGQARHDWQIAVDFAQRLEVRLRPDQPTLFPWKTAEALWQEHRESTRGRDLDITGLSYALLDEAGPQQWPLPEGQARGQARLYADGRFPTTDGRARFFSAEHRPVAEAPDAEFPFSLNSGRLRDQWHGMSRTGTLGRLFGHSPEPTLELHTQDLQRLGLAEGQLATVRSRRGALVLAARSSPAQAPGQAHIAMHWGPEALLGGVNLLTQPAFCPQSKQPELKHSAVHIAPAALAWHLLAAAWVPVEAVAEARRRLQALMPRFGFANLVPFGQQQTGLLLRAAATDVPGADVLAAIEEALGLAGDDPALLRYTDAGRGVRRSLRLSGTLPARQLQGLVLAGPAAQAGQDDWALALLQQGQAVAATARELLAPGGRLHSAPSRHQVCNCFDVDEDQIRRQLLLCQGAPDQRLAGLQSALKCGTQCGSCLPALRRLVQAVPAPA